jgi:hypothetical protein
VDIAPQLVALARERLPHRAGRNLEGNAAAWVPPLRFDVVRTGLEYAPRPRRAALLAHLRAHALQPGGRLLVGPYTEERDETRARPSLEDEVRSFGFAPASRLERPHPRDDRAVRRLLVLDV